MEFLRLCSHKLLLYAVQYLNWLRLSSLLFDFHNVFMHANFRTGGEEGSSSATTTLHCTGFLWSLKISLKSCFFNLDDLMAGERARERPSHQVLNKLCLSTSNMLVKENANRFPSISSLCCTSHVMTLFRIFGMMNIRGRYLAKMPNTTISHLSRLSPFVAIARAVLSYSLLRRRCSDTRNGYIIHLYCTR